MSSTLDEIIEEAAYIWLNERDDQPCSIRRARLLQMCAELPAQSQSRQDDGDPRPARIHGPDCKCRAANDDTWNTDPELIES